MCANSSISVLAEPLSNPAVVKDVESEITNFSENSGGLGGAYISNDGYIDANDFSKPLGDNSVILRAGWQNLPGTTYRYEQLDPYYCVPATMQTILRYNTGNLPPSQASIATAMDFKSGSGVDFLKVPSYLNGKQTNNTYAMHTKSDKSTMCSKIKADMTEYIAPTSIRISVSNSSDWLYTTAGHALVCNSIMSDNSSVQLVDPGVGYSWYTKSTDTLYKVFTDLAW